MKEPSTFPPEIVQVGEETTPATPVIVQETSAGLKPLPTTDTKVPGTPTDGVNVIAADGNGVHVEVEHFVNVAKPDSPVFAIT